jgi:hypothetical protein
MENVGIFCAHLEYIMAIWYHFLSFGNFVAVWYTFHRFGLLCQDKSGNPGAQSQNNFLARSFGILGMN